MNRFKAWLRGWLRIEELKDIVQERIIDIEKTERILQHEIRELRAEVTRLQIAQYVPPSQPEPERKVIRTQTFKQFTDILEREQETSDAV